MGMEQRTADAGGPVRNVPVRLWIYEQREDALPSPIVCAGAEERHGYKYDNEYGESEGKKDRTAE